MQAKQLLLLCLALLCQQILAQDLKVDKKPQNETSESEDVEGSNNTPAVAQVGTTTGHTQLATDHSTNGITHNVTSAKMTERVTNDIVTKEPTSVSSIGTAKPIAQTKLDATIDIAEVTEGVSVNPTTDLSIKDRTEINIPHRQEISKYLIDLFSFENSVTKATKIGTDNEIYQGKGLGFDNYIFQKELGSLIQAGPRNRARFFAKTYKCKGLRNLYQYFNHTEQAYRLTFDYRDTNNKGDRQPIGMCAAKHGDCGGDRHLYVYSGTYKTANNVTRTGYYYSNDEKEKFTPDRANFKLINDGKPLCHIYSRSFKQQDEDKITNANQTIHLRNLNKETFPMYEYEDENTIWYSERLDTNDNYFKGHAFNLIRHNSYILKYCKNSQTFLQSTFNVSTPAGAFNAYVYAPNYKTLERVLKKYTWSSIERQRQLGKTLGNCGPRVRYAIYQQKPLADNVPGKVYVARDGQKRNSTDTPFFDSYFYSI